MKKIFVLIFLISMVLLISLIGLRDLEKKSSYQGKATLTIVTIGNTTVEELDINGQTALELLKKNHNVETIKTGPSKMIKCIDGVCAKGGFWWQFHVNGELTLSSVDKYYPKESEIILLKYGEEE